MMGARWVSPFQGLTALMPRRNLHCLLLITLFSLVCYQKVPGSRYSRVLADAMDHVSRRFYLPVDELNLFEGAMSGMIERLGDEHSKYIKAAKKQDFEEDLNQEFVGIGIRPAIDPKTKQFLVLSPLPERPRLRRGHPRRRPHRQDRGPEHAGLVAEGCGRADSRQAGHRRHADD